MNTELRTAYLLDIDNLCGQAMATEMAILEVLDAFKKQCKPGENDQVYCAATAKAALMVKMNQPGFNVKVGRGKDGSDLRLLDIADPVWLAARFDRVVIGSGDGIFSELAANLAGLGLPVEVLCGHGSLSQSFIRALRTCPHPNCLQITQLNFAIAA